MCTGSSSIRRGVTVPIATLLASLLVGPAAAQSLRLRSIPISPDVQLGRWVSFQATLQTQNHPARDLTQRIAVVAAEGSGSEAGYWVELKTVDAGKMRIERGFFGQPFPEEGEARAPSDRPPLPLDLRRYQMLTPAGKLYEYPLDSESAVPPDRDVSAIDLFEFLQARPQDCDTLGADTLRIGRKVIPCVRYRVRRVSAEEWADEDTSFVDRAVMTEIFWLNSAIPITGYAKSVLEVAARRRHVSAPTPDFMSAEPEAAAASDSAAVVAPAGERLYFRGELSLLDLGTGAVSEVTQDAELAPEESAPAPPIK